MPSTRRPRSPAATAAPAKPARAKPAAAKRRLSTSRGAPAVPLDARPADLAAARAALLAYFDAHRRDLPWRRRAHDPYAVWVSEIMLQQTRVETVIPYYERFLERFPTPRALADAPLDAVLASWSGLGYYRRARMLHEGARAVVREHQGALPADAAALRALPGIGAYTAGAIASIAFGLREPLVDGNVERVLARVLALGGDPRAAATKKRLWTAARALADDPRPGDVNQALMELGATVCTPVSPRCLLCPLRAQCAARAAGDPERYPEKPARAAVRTEQWSALVATPRTASPASAAVWLAPSAIGRWTGMLLPPLVRSDESADAVAWFASLGVRHVAPAGQITHVLTHAAMAVTVYRGELPGAPPHGRLVAAHELDALAVPKITRVVLARAGFAA